MKITLLEILVQDKGLDPKEALSMIMSGAVQVNGQTISKQGLKYDPQKCVITIQHKSAYVSRAANKLIGGLAHWQVDIKGKLCLDLGCSHGGFSQVLLNHDVAHIYAVDVAYGIYDYKLRQSPKITLMEKKNIRNISRDWFDEATLHQFAKQGLYVVCDISFMSLLTVLDSLQKFLSKSDTDMESKPIDMQGLFLLKPQFENSKATKSGILNDAGILQEILQNFETQVRNMGYGVLGHTKAKLKGRQGNQEFVYYLSYPAPAGVHRHFD